MNFIQVIKSLRTIKRLCQETPACKQCRLHDKVDENTCGVCPSGNIPARWKFDEDEETTVPSIFK